MGHNKSTHFLDQMAYTKVTSKYSHFLHKQQHFVLNSVQKHVSYFLVSSLSIVIYSYNENLVQIMCHDVYNTGP